MTTRIEQLHSRPSQASRLGAFVHQIERALARRREAIFRTRRRRSAIRDLRSLSNRELRDIGIERHQIAEVVDGLLAREAAAGESTQADARRRAAVHCTATQCHA